MKTNVMFHVKRIDRRISRHEIGTRYHRLARVALTIAKDVSYGLHGAARRLVLTSVYHKVFGTLTAVRSREVRNYPDALRIARRAVA